MNPNETTPVGRVTPCAPQTSPTNDGEGRARLSERAALTNFTDSARGATRPTNDRRRFLKLAGATLLAGAALPKAAQAGHTGGVNISDGTSIIYFGGVVTSAAAPGVILNVYLAVDEDGTGVGTVSDTIHPQLNSHLAVQRGGRHGNDVRLEGVVRAANDAALVGRAFVVAGVVTENFTSLALRLDDATFTGKGFFVSAPKALTGTLIVQ